MRCPLGLLQSLSLKSNMDLVPQAVFKYPLLCVQERAWVPGAQMKSVSLKNLALQMQALIQEARQIEVLERQ